MAKKIQERDNAMMTVLGTKEIGKTYTTMRDEVRPSILAGNTVIVFDKSLDVHRKSEYIAWLKEIGKRFQWIAYNPTIEDEEKRCKYIIDTVRKNKAECYFTAPYHVKSVKQNGMPVFGSELAFNKGGSAKYAPTITGAAQDLLKFGRPLTVARNKSEQHKNLLLYFEDPASYFRNAHHMDQFVSMATSLRHAGTDLILHIQEWDDVPTQLIKHSELFRIHPTLTGLTDKRSVVKSNFDLLKIAELIVRAEFDRGNKYYYVYAHKNVHKRYITGGVFTDPNTGKLSNKPVDYETFRLAALRFLSLYPRYLKEYEIKGGSYTNAEYWMMHNLLIEPDQRDRQLLSYQADVLADFQKGLENIGKK